MENEITGKRGFILILVIATMVVFIGLVWLIARNVPWNLLNIPVPSSTKGVPSAEMNCTFPVSYWGLHPELYPPQVVLGSETYQANEIEGILTVKAQNVSGELERQLVGVFLNISAGADQDLLKPPFFKLMGGWNNTQKEARSQIMSLKLGPGCIMRWKHSTLGCLGF